jgi:two-component system, NarL family, sensor kinase
LIVGLRSGQRRLGADDIAVLELLAGPLAVALHATALSAALQESRVGIVAAREEERRRLRRDLHDGLGPVLTGIAFKADAVSNTLADQPRHARDLLAALRADTTAAIDDIRRLVDGLRPPALDDLGLIGSLREQSARLAQRPGGGRVAVCLNAPDSLPPLPAAVEVAAYRIITESMTNAARHSGATRIDVRLSLAGDHGLRIEVRDDGTSPHTGWRPGVGLTSMRERAAELGGSCQAGPDPAGGGRVVALLPLGGSKAEQLDPASAEWSIPFQNLTGRERQVLDLIAAGVRNAEIARRMSIAPKTVANHVSAIFTKLQVADRGEAIILARDAGFGRNPPSRTTE